MADTPEQVRAQRPDPAAGATKTKLDEQGHTTDTKGPENGNTDGVVAADQVPDTKGEDTEGKADKPAPTETVFKGPFVAVGHVVQDSGQRTVLIVGAAHMTPEARSDATAWIVEKLNS